MPCGMGEDTFDRCLGVLTHVSRSRRLEGLCYVSWGVGEESHTFIFIRLFVGRRTGDWPSLLQKVVIFCILPRHVTKLGYDLSALFHIHFSHIVLSSSALWSY
jgi:hypothetical protein